MGNSPQSPQELLESLSIIFPEFREHFKNDESDALTYPGILREFAYFFGKHSTIFLESQLRDLGSLVSEAVLQPGALENALGTCFLEHLHQIKAESVLRPYLSKKAYGMTRP